MREDPISRLVVRRDSPIGIEGCESRVLVSDMPVLLNSEILAEDAVVHEQPGAEFELLPGVAFAVKNEPQLVGDCPPN